MIMMMLSNHYDYDPSDEWTNIMKEEEEKIMSIRVDSHDIELQTGENSTRKNAIRGEEG